MSDLYFKFQQTPLSISESLVGKIISLTRTDPRLLEVITEFIRDYWFVLEPHVLNHFIKKTPDQAVLKAMIATIFTYCKMEVSVKIEFTEWSKIVLAGIAIPSKKSLFYNSDEIKVGGGIAKRIVSHSIPTFTENGYYFSDLPFNKGIPKSVKSLNDNSSKISSIEKLKIQSVLKIKEKTLKLTNLEVSDLAHTNTTTVSKILNNKFDTIKLETLLKIQNAISV